jgi:hypothetical protein
VNTPAANRLGQAGARLDNGPLAVARGAPGRRRFGFWSRKASSGDAALVVALTVALAAGAEIPVGGGEIRI